MLRSLPEFVQNYWMYLAGVAVVSVIMCYFSSKFCQSLKKGLLLFLVLFGLVAAYELLSGQSIFSLPGRIENKLSEKPADPETGRRYYKKYEERYGGEEPK